MKSEDDMAKVVTKFLIWGIFILVVLIAIFGGFYTIQAGQKGILLTWGKPTELAINEGLHYKIPIAQKIVKINIQSQKFDAPASSASSDLQVVNTQVTVNYHLPSDDLVKLYRDVGMSYESKIIQPAVQEVVKASTAKYTAEQLITKRELVKEDIDTALRVRLSEYGIFMETTSITDFDFSDQFNTAIEAKVTAEQNALTEKNKLAQVEFVAKQKIAEANGVAESVKLSAKAQADAKLMIAEAEAKALELQKLQASDNVLELRRIEVQKSYADRWNGNLPTTVIGGTGAIPLLQLPTNGLNLQNGS